MAQERLDLLVVGGGITGAGVALDAASRGLRTGLVEADDYASGTSQWSSKMVHGGLRYLATGQVGIAWESARERHHLLTVIAPHLVRPRRSLAPFLPGMSRPDARIMRSGIGVADLLRRGARTPSSVLPSPRTLSARELATTAPALAASGQRGGVEYWDGELEDDARLVLTVLRTAVAHGALVANHAAASDLHCDGAIVRDALSGNEFGIRARVVVNATGVWVAEHEKSLHVIPSRGSHLVVDAARLGGLDAMVSFPVAGERGRYVLAKPYADGLVLIGLTDEEDRAADGHRPAVPDVDERFLLEAASAGFGIELGHGDVVGRFAGLRPLVEQAGRSTADVSRDHVVVDQPDRPIAIVGGKLTTYRAMAQDVVDRVVGRLGLERDCRTATLPLVGAAAPQVLRRLPERPEWIARYGTLARDLDALVAADPQLGLPAVEGSRFTRAELRYGVTHEGALTAEDVVARRARIGLRSRLADAAMTVAEGLLACSEARHPAG
ncbi:glycerol-3-phosphate dehydrogenase/oxidase [Calidifontibacter sp. DB0510]|uniref:Glycerol-3-phosphate dehydrogenase n=2 Tax=Metallococcus carri TaxID=1656884 RepID=A0A967E9S7_9MICO|nr:glycerol-3-phosphate dehydrogenase/oxidase [Metallococcus carri]NOP36221.1 glycerol-3-phosphate dehydrogenase/oxidase [Calidifontibacter sp. DB2511S]